MTQSLSASHRSDTPKTAKMRAKRGISTASNRISDHGFDQWFALRGWEPLDFQQKTWDAYARGESGLLQVATGSGKTYAACGGPLAELLTLEADQRLSDHLYLLYVTPLRALSRDVEKALQAPLTELGSKIRLESRTGDTGSSARQRQRKRLPQVLVTTPESLCLLLSYSEAFEQFKNLRCVVVDEWHELQASKRGVQMELALARLRHHSPRVRTWALSATLANPDAAARQIVGLNQPATIIKGDIKRQITLRTLLPQDTANFPKAGFLGLPMLPILADDLDINESTLIFTNTRSQAERWYQELLQLRPEWAGLIAMHHGSLDQDARRYVEDAVKSGQLKLVVCTSSLDLGVDFPPVARVYQIGSPKGIARLIQRAGRANHRLGADCTITCVPTHALELLEYSATRTAINGGQLEQPPRLDSPLDVLFQHLVTCAAAGGFQPDDLFSEIVSTDCYQNLKRGMFDWCLDLLITGGATLKAYDHYQKLQRTPDGRIEMPKGRPLQLHRMNIGTISSDAMLRVQFLKGARLGQIEEAFVARLKKGDRFVFAGRNLELVMVKEDTALVRLSRRKSRIHARWAGSRLPISESLGDSMIRTLTQLTKNSDIHDAEIDALAPVLEEQKHLSAQPQQGHLLAEICHTREGRHLFLYPFAGLLVHEGLAAVLALRLSRQHAATFTLAANDYGLELLTDRDYPYERLLDNTVFTPEDLNADINASLDLSQLARRQFRDIARVAGLVYQNYPGKRHAARQLQASAGLLYDVFKNHDPDNLLIYQARRETLEQHFETRRLLTTMERLFSSRLAIHQPPHPTPFSLPILVERASGQLSGESLTERLQKLLNQWTTP